MSERNSRPFSGNNHENTNSSSNYNQGHRFHRADIKVPIHSHTEDEERRRRQKKEYLQQQQEPVNRNNGNRGYRMDRLPQPSSSRWNSRGINPYNNRDDYRQQHRNNRHDSYNDDDRHRRRGTAADRRTESSTDIGCRRIDDERLERKHRSSDRDNRENHSRRRRHEGIRDNHSFRDDRRPERERFHRDGDRADFDNEPADRFRYHRERSGNEYYSDDCYDNSRSDSLRRQEQSRIHNNSSKRKYPDRSDRRRRSEDYATDEDDVDRHKKKTFEKKARDKPIEWPPSFQKKESAFAFDSRSAMFYEPLSDFFYDPKSKLYYGNKKCAYFRYDETKDPPFIEVQKLTSDQVEEQKQQQQGDSAVGIIEPEKIALAGKNPAAAALISKPKIAILFKTKKVKSSVPAVVEQQQSSANGLTVSKAKQQQIANIGKWNEKQAELKKEVTPGQSSADEGRREGESLPQTLSQSKVRKTAKGEPICLLCKRKFPNLAKLRLHEKNSELHKKNLLKLQEKEKKNDEKQPQSQVRNGTKRKVAAENPHKSGIGTSAATTATLPMYTDRAEKRRQLHGVDLGAPVQHHVLQMLEKGFEAKSRDTMSSVTAHPTPSADLLDEKNVGHQLLQKMGYKADHPSDKNTNKNTDKPKTASDHLRKEWDRIEAMAQKSGSRYR